MEAFDTVVLGSGPGGYVCAIRCAQLGMKTALVEKYPTLGGTCLNVGCIPSKALLASSEHYHAALHRLSFHGVQAEGVKLDWQKMQERKETVVRDTVKGLDFLMKKNKIQVLRGCGSFASANEILVRNDEEPDRNQKVKANNVVIATGSKPSALPNVAIDKKRVLSSTEALSLSSVPKSMVVIGGGVIGMELGSVYAKLGTRIEVLEYLDRLIPNMDGDLSRQLLRSMKKMGVVFHFKHKVLSAQTRGKKVKLEAENAQGKKTSFEAEYCLVSVGRKPYSEGLGLEAIGVETDGRGCVKVDKCLRTGVAGVYAIGDVIGGAMLAHKAEEEGVFVAELLAGQKPHVDYGLIPEVVYTWPEAAGIGATERELKEKGVPYKKGTFPFSALGRARATDETEGMVKILSHGETDQILGAHVFGSRASDLIADLVTAMEYRASAEDLARMSHAHPTFAEAIKEACLAASDKRPIHM